MTYAELRELSYMGASVLHEEAIFPVKDAGIPLVIKNTNRPDDPGTVISEETEPGMAEPIITGIAGKRDFVAVHIRTNHMSNQVGSCAGAFHLRALSRSIEHTFLGHRFVRRRGTGGRCEDCLCSIVGDIQRELEPDEIEVIERLALISTVGRNMSSRPGISGRLFGGWAAQVNTAVRPGLGGSHHRRRQRRGFRARYSRHLQCIRRFGRKCDYRRRARRERFLQ
ncbi:MAG: hypothetical protein ACLT98_03985 [Eggerthellaceae bacterium]